MQPSVAHTPPVLQQRPLTEEDRRIIPKRVGLAKCRYAESCDDNMASQDKLKHEPVCSTPVLSTE